MQLVEYNPELFVLLRQAADRVGPNCNLCHRPFVDYYYATREWCKLYLLLADDGTVAGTIGVDRMRFELDFRETTLGFASNFYAFQVGAGGLLFLRWMQLCAAGLVFGGSQDAHRIYRNQQWTYFKGVKTYYLNRPYTSYPGEAWWRTVAKMVLRRISGPTTISRCASRIPPEAVAELSVREERIYTADLLPPNSPFTLRFSPNLDYLSWRYSTELSFVHYRLFRILARGISVGYVIINESPERLIVSQCDGEDPSTLAYGVLLSLSEVAREDEIPRKVILSSCHPGMQQIYERFGFTAGRVDRPFALGALRRSIDMSTDTTNWLINYDWGDNGLRAPFRNQTLEGEPDGQ